MRVLLIALLAAISYAQTDSYFSHTSRYIFASKGDARAACQETAGFTLCSAAQLYNAVFADGHGDLCYSGWVDDNYVGAEAGWFNKDGNCGEQGWNGWTPTNPGAHCCATGYAELEILHCGMYDASLCISAGNKIIIDDASDVWITTGEMNNDNCCQDFQEADLYKSIGGYTEADGYIDGQAADEACAANHPDLALCSRTQLEYLDNVRSSGYFATEYNSDHEPIAFDQGFYENTGEGDERVFRAWKPSSGYGSAHCCVKGYKQGAYNSITPSNTETAAAFCSSQQYTYSLCSKDQLRTIVYGMPSVRAEDTDTGEAPSICMSGQLSDASGWYQGIAGQCGPTGWKAWTPNNAGAHCCLGYIPAYEEPIGEFYGPMPFSADYSAGYTSGAAAQNACINIGYDDLCTLAQQATMAMNPSMQGAIQRRVGWVIDNTYGDGGFDSGYWHEGIGEWKNAWQPAHPIAHCCMNTVEEYEIVTETTTLPAPTDLYYNGDWDYTHTYDSAVAKCAEFTGYTLCTKDQVEVIASSEVTYDGVTQGPVDRICRIGWYQDGDQGSTGWYQHAEGACGPTGWRIFEYSTASYHCCRDFPTSVEPTDPPKPPVFLQLSGGYQFTTEDAAEAACQQQNSDYSLCADYEMVKAAEEGAGLDDSGDDLFPNFAGVAPQLNIALSVWLDSERQTLGKTYGWYSYDGTSGSWRSWRPQNADGDWNLGAFCCYSDAFEAEAPVSTEPLSPTLDPTVATTTLDPTVATTMETTLDPTADPTTTSTSFDPSETLPSSLAISGDCQDTGFKVEGFDSITFCALDGFVYLNGRNTCVPSTTSENVMHNSLTTVWNDQWYLAAEPCDGGKTYDEATQDQLWITNEMCNNLEKDIGELESSTANYMDNWTQSVIDLVNDNMGAFSEDTQRALDNYLEQLQNGQN